MCDYSLENVKTRRANVGDRLFTHRFSFGTVGFAASEDIDVAVCVPPGTELSFACEVKRSDCRRLLATQFPIPSYFADSCGENVGFGSVLLGSMSGKTVTRSHLCEAVHQKTGLSQPRSLKCLNGVAGKPWHAPAVFFEAMRRSRRRRGSPSPSSSPNRGIGNSSSRRCLRRPPGASVVASLPFMKPLVLPDRQNGEASAKKLGSTRGMIGLGSIFGTTAEWRIFHTPPSRTSTSVHRPSTFSGPSCPRPVISYLPTVIAASVPNGET